MNKMRSFAKIGQNPKTLERVSCTSQSGSFVSLTKYIARNILAEYGYRLNIKKMNIRRKHQQQKVTGLVVNEKIALPRKTRRWLRAVQHHLETGKPASLTTEQIAGWQAIQQMIENQSNALSNE
jgi:retron-type reverse transcriptase